MNVSWWACCRTSAFRRPEPGSALQTVTSRGTLAKHEIFSFNFIIQNKVPLSSLEISSINAFLYSYDQKNLDRPTDVFHVAEGTD